MIAEADRARLDPTALARLREAPISEGTKACPPAIRSIAQLEAAGLTAADLPLPAMLLRREALEHNLAEMARWCERQDVLIAPHGKTTMAPQLLDAQLEAGAWAITVATGAQLRSCRKLGVRRALVANQLVDSVDLAWLKRELEEAPDFEPIVFVDSVDGVVCLDRALAGSCRPVLVLIEIGYEGGRCGCRDAAGVDAVITAIGRSGHLRLAGFAGYEGLIEGRDEQETVECVDAFIDRIGEIFASRAAHCDVDRPLVSAGGSAYFDRVVDRLADAAGSAGGRLVLRSGCYLTHDHGAYARAAAHGLAGRPVMLPAIEVWGRVLSCPEPRRAIIGLGKRDISFDAGFPQPLAVLAGGERPEPIPISDAEVLQLDDQHLHLQVAAGQPGLGVGDAVAFGISHPCTTFDRWRLIPVIDAGRRVVTAVSTRF